MNCPCVNCILVPICNKKEIIDMVSDCILMKQYIFENITQKSTDEYHIVPKMIVLREAVFEVTHFPLLRDKHDRYYDGVGFQTNGGGGGHVMIGRLDASKQIKTSYPVHFIREGKPKQ
jgi:hypothetical protein